MTLEERICSRHNTKTFNGNIPENIINKLSNVPNVFWEDAISEIEEEHDWSIIIK